VVYDANEEPLKIVRIVHTARHLPSTLQITRANLCCGDRVLVPLSGGAVK
jgi:hypothetical protein